MAFFKFRFPGQTAPAESNAAGPNENIEVIRRRARHRLIGAVVLVLSAVVGFPLLFDTQPRPVEVDTPILIPDRQATPPLSSSPVPASQAPAPALLPPPAVVSTQASLDAQEEVVPATPPVSLAPAEPVSAETVKPVKTEKSDKKEKATSSDNGQKAAALLEGKSAPDAQVDDKPKGRIIIQVGAFSDKAKIRDVRRKLEKAGFQTYTQDINKDGERTTRIRVGPYETREDAEKAAKAIRKLELPASVLKI
jgi:DedD protein